MEMTWGRLLSEKRASEDFNRGSEARTNFNIDHDRIIFSQSFRRLSKKTQVHPLSQNDHVHTRLIHSLEVASVGRTLGAMVYERIKDDLRGAFDRYHIVSIINNACLIHDIGNPPFGHAGEYAIREWFDSRKLPNTLTPDQVKDLLLFEGNAQGFRIVTSLESYINNGGLRLTYATLGSMIKYPWISNCSRADKKGKFNVFQSQLDSFKDISSVLGLIEREDGSFARHPFSYLMEAADDICYKILDIEDALELNILKFDDIKGVLSKISERDIDFSGKLMSERDKINISRAFAITNLTHKICDVFIEHLGGILSGKFEGDLFSKLSGDCKNGINEAKEMTTKSIFSNRRKIELEVGAHSAIEVLLTAFIEAIDDYISKADPAKNMKFKNRRIIELMDSSLLERKTINNHYEGYMCVTDFVSGMTDNYATYLAKQLRGEAV